jgi:hypothetical protein
MTRIEDPGSDLDEVLGSTASMDFDTSSVEGEVQLEVYIQVQQVDTDKVSPHMGRTMSTNVFIIRSNTRAKENTCGWV